MFIIEIESKGFAQTSPDPNCLLTGFQVKFGITVFHANHESRLKYGKIVRERTAVLVLFFCSVATIVK